MNLLCRKVQEERWRENKRGREGRREMGERDEEGERERLLGQGRF